MAFVWLCAWKDLRRRAADPGSVALWCGIPVLIATLMVVAFGGGSGSTPQAHVLLVDEDDSFVSGLLAGAFSRAGDVFVVENVSRDEGQARIDDGDASALLIIPAGFGQALFEREPTTLELVTNPAQTIMPGIVQGTLEVLVDGTFYVQQLFGDVLDKMVEGPPDGARTFPALEVAAMSVQINDIVDSVAGILDPPLIELEATIESTDSGGFDFGLLLFPGILFMGLLFTAQGLSEDLWRERSQGTLRRLLTTPRTVSAFLAGKLAAAALILLGVSLVGLAAGALMFGVDPLAVPLAVLWACVSGLLLVLLFFVLQLHASSERGGSVLTNLVLFPLMFLGGSFFPVEQMPGGLAAVGRWTPNGWALGQFKALLAGRAEPATLLGGLAVFVALGGVLTLLCARRIRSRFAGA